MKPITGGSIAAALLMGALLNICITVIAGVNRLRGEAD